MTRSEKIRDAGFEFARMLANPAFREEMRAERARQVIIALGDEPVLSVMRRVLLKPPPVLVAIRRPGVSVAFAFISIMPPAKRRFWQPKPSPRHYEETIAMLTSSSSIGMLYDSLREPQEAVAGPWFDVSRVAHA